MRPTPTLRYHEEHGLVRPRRDADGYRQYDDAELRGPYVNT